MSYKIIYIHPAIRIYRKKLFTKLSKDLNIDFFWSGKPKYKSHISNEITRILSNTDINYTQANTLQNLPIDGFSLSLFSLIFKKYKIYIFSNITSIPYLMLAPLLKILGKKIILFDELWRYPKEVKKYRIIYPYVRVLTKYCLDGVVTAGTKAKEFYIEEFDFDSHKIEIAYNTTIDTKKYINDENINENIKNKLKKITTKKSYYI